MCDPVSIATVASIGFQAMGQINAGKQAAESAKFNAAVANNNSIIAQQNATLAGREGAVNTEAQQLKTRATVGGIKAAQAANGVDVNSGSAVDVRSSAAELGELSAINIRSSAVRQAYGYQTESASDKAQEQLDRQQAKYDTQAGYTNAAGTILGGATKAGQSETFGNWLGGNSLNSTNYGTSFGPDAPGASVSYGP